MNCHQRFFLLILATRPGFTRIVVSKQSSRERDILIQTFLFSYEKKNNPIKHYFIITQKNEL